MSRRPDPSGAIAQARVTLGADPSRSWTASELAGEIGCSVHQAAAALLYLADRGELLRTRNPKSRARSSYRAPGVAERSA